MEFVEEEFPGATGLLAWLPKRKDLIEFGTDRNGATMPYCMKPGCFLDPKHDGNCGLAAETVSTRPTRPDRPLPQQNASKHYNQEQKADGGKLPISRLPWGPLKQVVKVLVHGKEKYGKWAGWQEVEHARERYTDALLRHAVDYAQGVREDADSGLPTLAHLCCDALFILWFDGFK